jgi:hypothetical protein
MFGNFDPNKFNSQIGANFNPNAFGGGGGASSGSTSGSSNFNPNTFGGGSGSSGSKYTYILPLFLYWPMRYNKKHYWSKNIT